MTNNYENDRKTADSSLKKITLLPISYYVIYYMISGNSPFGNIIIFSQMFER